MIASLSEVARKWWKLGWWSNEGLRGAAAWPKIGRGKEQLGAERIHSVLSTEKTCSRPKRGLYNLASRNEKKDERIEGAGGQSRESRDDIGIGSVRHLGERGTANDKVPACCPDTKHTRRRQLPPPYQTRPRCLPGSKCDVDTYIYPRRPAASTRRHHKPSAATTTHPPTSSECALNHLAHLEPSPPTHRSFHSSHSSNSSRIAGLVANASLCPSWLKPLTTTTSRFP